jgi:hypothetical protein
MLRLNKPACLSAHRPRPAKKAPALSLTNGPIPSLSKVAGLSLSKVAGLSLSKA